MGQSNTLLRRLVRPYRSHLVIALVAMGFHALATGLYAYLVGPLLAFLFTGGQSGYEAFFVLLPGVRPEGLDRTALTWILPGIIVAVAALKGVAYYLHRVHLGELGEGLGASLRRRLFRSLVGSESRATEMRGDLATRVGTDVDMVQTGVVESLTAFVRDGLTLLVLMGLALWLDWKLAVLAFLVLPAAIIPIVRFARSLRRSTRDGLVARGDLAGQLVEAMANRLLLRHRAAVDSEVERYDNRVEELRSARLRAITAKAINHPVMELLGVGGLAATLWYAGFRIWAGTLSPADFVSFFAAVLMLYEPLKGLSRAMGYTQEVGAAVDRLMPLMDLPAPVTGQLPPSRLESLALEDVSLARGGRPVIHVDELTIHAGDCVLITGPSGAGKTTLLLAIIGALTPQSGTLSWNGTPLHNYNRDGLAERIGFLDQDARCFGRTIRENLTLGRSIPDERLQEALAKAGAADFVRERGGLGASLTEAGDDLSGGQRRRLALARALTLAPDLLVLDEPTDAVDPETESHILEQLRVLSGKTTLILVAHRAEVPWATRTVTVADGGLEIEARKPSSAYSRPAAATS